MNSATIRSIQPADVPAVARLLEALGRKTITFEFSPSAEEKFLLSNNEAAINKFIGDDFRYWVAEKDRSIAWRYGSRANKQLQHDHQIATRFGTLTLLGGI